MRTRRLAFLALLLYAAPLAVLLAWRVAPLAAGGETLFLRDVFATHLAMKWAQAEAMREGELPLVDPHRAGGQPLAGNPNAVPFYPDNLLYLVAPPLWAFNAHFWLHLLAAPFAMYAFGRALGLGRPGAWAAGVCYGFSGYVAAQMSFYNLVAGAALAPALGAAVVAAAAPPSRPGTERRADRRSSRRAAAAAGLLWALVVLAGDPLLAVVALALAASAVFAGPRSRTGAGLGARLGTLAAALAAGTVVALPQIVELARIAPLSFRGFRGYSPLVRTVASFDPRQALEWLLPFAFGRPDLLGPGSFWGHPYYTGTPPFYFTLYPGLLALALVAAAGLPGRRRGAGSPAAAVGPHSRLVPWAWAAVAAGLFFALGRFNPLVDHLFALSPAGALRYPIKFWLPVAVAAAALCGVGFERALGRGPGDDEGEGEGGAVGGRPVRLIAPLAALAALFAATWLALLVAPAAAERLLRAMIPARFPDPFVAAERLRWSGLCLASLAVAALLLAAALLARRRPALGGALLVAVHAASQLGLLAPALATDEAGSYAESPPLVAALPAGATVVHGAVGRLFGPSALELGTFPEPRARWLARRAHGELYPFAGVRRGYSYALNVSPEGLDSVFTRLAAAAVAESDDPRRVRLLAAWGVDRLILDRPLSPAAAARARLIAARLSFGGAVNVYEIPGAAPELTLATRVVRAPHMNAAVAALLDDGFDPRSTVVLPGEPGAPPVEPGFAGPAADSHGSATGASVDGPAAAAGELIRVVRRGRESLEAATRSPLPGVLVWQRAYLALYRARVDGRDVSPVVANLHHLGVEVPAGEHRVEIWADRRPLRRAALGSLAGLAVLALLAAGVGAGRGPAGR